MTAPDQGAAIWRSQETVLAVQELVLILDPRFEAPFFPMERRISQDPLNSRRASPSTIRSETK